MRRNILILGLVVACFITILSFRVAEAGEQGSLRIIENDWPPYYFKNKSDKLPGFARELLSICISRLGYRAEFTFYPVKRMYAYLERGELDISIFSHKKSREDLVHFGHEPLFVSGYRPVVRSGSGIGILSLADFDDLKIGHLAGLRYSEAFLTYIDKRRKAGTLITGTTGDSCLRMLTENIIDIFVDSKNTVLWRAQQTGITEKITILDYDIQTSRYFVTVSKASPRIADKPGFLEQMDDCLRVIKKDGRYREIARKYGL